MIGLDHKLILGQSPSQSDRISRPRKCLQTRIRCVAPVTNGSRISKKPENLDAVIVGGGLAGLSAAVGLQSLGLNFKVLSILHNHNINDSFKLLYIALTLGFSS